MKLEMQSPHELKYTFSFQTKKRKLVEQQTSKALHFCLI